MKKIILILIVLLSGLGYMSAKELIIKRPPRIKNNTSVPKNHAPSKNRNNGPNSEENNKTMSTDHDSGKRQPNSKNINKNNPKSFYEAILEKWNLSAYNEFLAMYPDNPLSKQIFLRKQEIELWQTAKKQNTIDSYREYLAKSNLLHFENEAKKYIYSLKQQDDEVQELAWQEACIMNTIEAYETFLSAFPYSPHRDEALKIKRNLNAKKDWETNVRPSYDVSIYEKFLIVYPDFPDRNEVESYINAEKGKTLYEKGDNIKAFIYFRNVTDRNILDLERYQNAYKATREEGLYYSFNDDTPSSELKEFLDEYPYSRYYNSVADSYGLSLAKNFNTTSTEEDYRTALHYINKAESHNIVKQLIKENKQLQKRELNSRFYESDDIGIDDYSDQISGLTHWRFGSQWNIIGVGRACEKTIAYSSIGWRFGYENFNSRISTILSFNIGLVISGQEMEKEDDLPIRLRWRINFELHEKFKVVRFGKCWLVADGGIYWNTCRDHKYERPFAFSVGPGITTHFIEWNIFYLQEFGKYSGGLNAQNSYNPWFIGTSLGFNILYF